MASVQTYCIWLLSTLVWTLAYADDICSKKECAITDGYGVDYLNMNVTSSGSHLYRYRIAYQPDNNACLHSLSFILPLCMCSASVDLRGGPLSNIAGVFQKQELDDACRIWWSDLDSDEGIVSFQAKGQFGMGAISVRAVSAGTDSKYVPICGPICQNSDCEGSSAPTAIPSGSTRTATSHKPLSTKQPNLTSSPKVTKSSRSTATLTSPGSTKASTIAPTSAKISAAKSPSSSKAPTRPGSSVATISPSTSSLIAKSSPYPITSPNSFSPGSSKLPNTPTSAKTSIAGLSPSSNRPTATPSHGSTKAPSFSSLSTKANTNSPPSTKMPTTARSHGSTKTQTSPSSYVKATTNVRPSTKTATARPSPGSSNAAISQSSSSKALLSPSTAKGSSSMTATISKAAQSSKAPLSPSTAQGSSSTPRPTISASSTSTPSSILSGSTNAPISQSSFTKASSAQPSSRTQTTNAFPSTKASSKPSDTTTPSITPSTSIKLSSASPVSPSTWVATYSSQPTHPPSLSMPSTSEVPCNESVPSTTAVTPSTSVMASPQISSAPRSTSSTTPTTAPFSSAGPASPSKSTTLKTVSSTSIQSTAPFSSAPTSHPTTPPVFTPTTSSQGPTTKPVSPSTSTTGSTTAPLHGSTSVPTTKLSASTRAPTTASSTKAATSNPSSMKPSSKTPSASVKTSTAGPSSSSTSIKVSSAQTKSSVQAPMSSQTKAPSSVPFTPVGPPSPTPQSTSSPQSHTPSSSSATSSAPRSPSTMMTVSSLQTPPPSSSNAHSTGTFSSAGPTLMSTSVAVSSSKSPSSQQTSSPPSSSARSSAPFTSAGPASPSISVISSSSQTPQRTLPPSSSRAASSTPFTSAGPSSPSTSKGASSSAKPTLSSRSYNERSSAPFTSAGPASPSTIKGASSSAKPTSSPPSSNEHSSAPFTSAGSASPSISKGASSSAKPTSSPPSSNVLSSAPFTSAGPASPSTIKVASSSAKPTSSPFSSSEHSSAPFTSAGPASPSTSQGASSSAKPSLSPPSSNVLSSAPFTSAGPASPSTSVVVSSLQTSSSQPTLSPSSSRARSSIPSTSAGPASPSTSQGASSSAKPTASPPSSNVLSSAPFTSAGPASPSTSEVASSSHTSSPHSTSLLSSSSAPTHAPVTSIAPISPSTSFNTLTTAPFTSAGPASPSTSSQSPPSTANPTSILVTSSAITTLKATTSGQIVKDKTRKPTTKAVCSLQMECLPGLQTTVSNGYNITVASFQYNAERDLTTYTYHVKFLPDNLNSLNGVTFLFSSCMCANDMQATAFPPNEPVDIGGKFTSESGQSCSAIWSSLNADEGMVSYQFPGLHNVGPVAVAIDDGAPPDGSEAVICGPTCGSPSCQTPSASMSSSAKRSTSKLTSGPSTSLSSSTLQRQTSQRPTSPSSTTSTTSSAAVSSIPKSSCSSNQMKCDPSLLSNISNGYDLSLLDVAYNSTADTTVVTYSVTPVSDSPAPFNTVFLMLPQCLCSDVNQVMVQRIREDDLGGRFDFDNEACSLIWTGLEDNQGSISFSLLEEHNVGPIGFVIGMDDSPIVPSQICGPTCGPVVCSRTSPPPSVALSMSSKASTNMPFTSIGPLSPSTSFAKSQSQTTSPQSKKSLSSTQRSTTVPFISVGPASPSTTVTPSTALTTSQPPKPSMTSSSKTSSTGPVTSAGSASSLPSSSAPAVAGSSSSTPSATPRITSSSRPASMASTTGREVIDKSRKPTTKAQCGLQQEMACSSGLLSTISNGYNISIASIQYSPESNLTKYTYHVKFLPDNPNHLLGVSFLFSSCMCENNMQAIVFPPNEPIDIGGEFTAESGQSCSANWSDLNADEGLVSYQFPSQHNVGPIVVSVDDGAQPEGVRAMICGPACGSFSCQTPSTFTHSSSAATSSAMKPSSSHSLPSTLSTSIQPKFTSSHSISATPTPSILSSIPRSSCNSNQKKCDSFLISNTSNGYALSVAQMTYNATIDATIAIYLVTPIFDLSVPFNTVFFVLPQCLCASGNQVIAQRDREDDLGGRFVFDSNACSLMWTGLENNEGSISFLFSGEHNVGLVGFMIGMDDSPFEPSQICGPTCGPVVCSTTPATSLTATSKAATSQSTSFAISSTMVTLPSPRRTSQRSTTVSSSAITPSVRSSVPKSSCGSNQMMCSSLLLSNSSNGYNLSSASIAYDATTNLTAVTYLVTPISDSSTPFNTLFVLLPHCLCAAGSKVVEQRNSADELGGQFIFDEDSCSLMWISLEDNEGSVSFMLPGEYNVGPVGIMVGFDDSPLIPSQICGPVCGPAVCSTPSRAPSTSTTATSPQSTLLSSKPSSTVLSSKAVPSTNPPCSAMPQPQCDDISRSSVSNGFELSVKNISFNSITGNTTYTYAVRNHSNASQPFNTVFLTLPRCLCLMGIEVMRRQLGQDLGGQFIFDSEFCLASWTGLEINEGTISFMISGQYDVGIVGLMVGMDKSAIIPSKVCGPSCTPLQCLSTTSPSLSSRTTVRATTPPTTKPSTFTIPSSLSSTPSPSTTAYITTSQTTLPQLSTSNPVTSAAVLSTSSRSMPPTSVKATASSTRTPTTISTTQPFTSATPTSSLPAFSSSITAKRTTSSTSQAKLSTTRSFTSAAPASPTASSGPVTTPRRSCGSNIMRCDSLLLSNISNGYDMSVDTISYDSATNMTSVSYHVKSVSETSLPFNTVSLKLHHCLCSSGVRVLAQRNRTDYLGGQFIFDNNACSLMWTGLESNQGSVSFMLPGEYNVGPVGFMIEMDDSPVRPFTICGPVCGPVVCSTTSPPIRSTSNISPSKSSTSSIGSSSVIPSSSNVRSSTPSCSLMPQPQCTNASRSTVSNGYGISVQNITFHAASGNTTVVYAIRSISNSSVPFNTAFLALPRCFCLEGVEVMRLQSKNDFGGQFSFDKDVCIATWSGIEGTGGTVAIMLRGQYEVGDVGFMVGMNDVAIIPSKICGPSCTRVQCNSTRSPSSSLPLTSALPGVTSSSLLRTSTSKPRVSSPVPSFAATSLACPLDQTMQCPNMMGPSSISHNTTSRYSVNVERIYYVPSSNQTVFNYSVRYQNSPERLLQAVKFWFMPCVCQHNNSVQTSFARNNRTVSNSRPPTDRNCSIMFTKLDSNLASISFQLQGRYKIGTVRVLVEAQQAEARTLHVCGPVCGKFQCPMLSSKPNPHKSTTSSNVASPTISRRFSSPLTGQPHTPVSDHTPNTPAVQTPAHEPAPTPAGDSHAHDNTPTRTPTYGGTRAHYGTLPNDGSGCAALPTVASCKLLFSYPLYNGPGLLRAGLATDAKAQQAIPIMNSATMFSYTTWIYPQQFGPGNITVFGRSNDINNQLQGLPSLVLTPDGMARVNLQTRSSDNISWTFETCQSTTPLTINQWTQISITVDTTARLINLWYNDGSNGRLWACVFKPSVRFVSTPAAFSLASSVATSKICIGQVNFYPNVIRTSDLKLCLTPQPLLSNQTGDHLSPASDKSDPKAPTSSKPSAVTVASVTVACVVGACCMSLLGCFYVRRKRARAAAAIAANENASYP